VLGTGWCEDTALVRSRLDALGIPFDDQDVEADMAAGDRIRALNDGAQVTPTVVIGDGAPVAAEPSLEALTGLLETGGWSVRTPSATQYQAPLTEHPVPFPPSAIAVGGAPDRSLGGDAATFAALRGRRQVALFLAHGAACLPCFGYARQLARSGEALAGADAVAIVVVADERHATEAWREGLDPAATLASDPGGSWKGALAARVGFDPGNAALLLLDRWLAPRAGSVAGEAGGLIDPSEAVRWMAFLELECPECAGEIPWEPPAPVT